MAGPVLAAVTLAKRGPGSSGPAGAALAGEEGHHQRRRVRGWGGDDVVEIGLPEIQRLVDPRGDPPDVVQGATDEVAPCVDAIAPQTGRNGGRDPG